MRALKIITLTILITAGFCDMTATPHMSSELIKPTVMNLTGNSSTISSSLFTEGGITGIKNLSIHSTEASSSLSTNKVIHSTTTEFIPLNKTTNHTHHKISSRKDVKFDNITDTILVNSSVTEKVNNNNLVNKINNTSTLSNVTEYTKSSTVSATVNVTTSKPIRKKPVITVGDDEPYAPSNFQPKVSKPLLKNSSDIKLDNVLHASDRHTSAKVYEPDYVIPVVITILSVPLLIGFAMLMFKLGTHWWERRHYRRMDYLIEGMYNN